MKRKSIAERRAEAIYALAKRKTENPSTQDITDARRVMNSFYRLCGLTDRLLILENEEETCNLRSTRQMDARRQAWYDRLKGIFEAEYNATFICYGYLPTICEVDEKGRGKDLEIRHFYQN